MSVTPNRFGRGETLSKENDTEAGDQNYTQLVYGPIKVIWSDVASARLLTPDERMGLSRVK
jgi:hypothetical protein